RNAVHVSKDAARVFVLATKRHKRHKIVLRRWTMSRKLFIAALMLAIAFTANAQERPADAAAIRAHIVSIVQSFIDGNEDKIFATHSEAVRAFLEGSRTPINGIDEFMRANGIDWPRTANAPKSQPYFPAGTTYQMSDFNVHFYGP